MLEAINYFFLVLAIATSIACGFGAVYSDNKGHRIVYVICCASNAFFSMAIWGTIV